MEKFEYYLYGRKVIVETDHSPLEQIFKKNIAEVPARLQRLLLRCMKFDITVRYKAGKSIPVADALPRVCFKAGADLNKAGADLNKAETDLNKAEVDVNKEIHFITTKSCPIDIKSIQEPTMQDQDLNKLKDVFLRVGLNKGNSVHKNCGTTGHLDVTL